MTTNKHQILIVGGGSAGISVAARLARKGYADIAIIEPSDKHYYQPLWTLVGAGQAEPSLTERSQQSVIPKKTSWIKKAAEAFDPDQNTVTCTDGSTYEYDVLIVTPGIQLDWGKVEGAAETIGKNGVSSNYQFDLAPKMWDMIRNTHSGTAVFTMPSGPIKCAGAPQKIAYLAADHWRREGVLKDMEIHLVLPTPRTFGIPAIADSLDKVVADYGIILHTQSEVVSIDPDSKKVTIRDLTAQGDGGTIDSGDSVVGYDVMHFTPPQSAPDWVKSSPLSTGEGPGYVDVDKHTMQHVRYPNVFSLGDAGSTPNSKTGAAIRKQAPVVAENVDSHLKNEKLGGMYHGYASCPLVISNKKMLLAEFDYSMEMTPTFPTWMFNPSEPYRRYWHLKRYGLPFLYWNLMLKGIA
jgi:sulfide:quinone oxidoreductase